MIGYYEIPVDICNKNIIIYYDNVTGSKESSFNQNSNPGPLTDRASDQTTELLIPTNIQDIPLEGPSAASAASGARRRSRSKPHRQRVRMKEIRDEICTLFKENCVDP